jgi:Mycobacterium 19 kDa lipoprotein antigen
MVETRPAVAVLAFAVVLGTGLTGCGSSASAPSSMTVKGTAGANPINARLSTVCKKTGDGVELTNSGTGDSVFGDVSAVAMVKADGSVDSVVITGTKDGASESPYKLTASAGEAKSANNGNTYTVSGTGSIEGRMGASRDFDIVFACPKID